MNNYERKTSIGKISSIETMGLVDGPGVRTVVFMQGCPLRCKYCHNPETWEIGRPAKEYTPEQLAALILRYKNYMKHGGVTFSGGEPLLQSQFLSETAVFLKADGIHICLDTSGVISENPADEPGLLVLLEQTDLILLDVKASSPAQYKEITGQNMDAFLAFLDLVQHKNKKLWLRTVIVPGINNDPERIAEIQNFAGTVKNVERIEFLPYHTMGVRKYKELGFRYPLEGTPALTEAEIRYP
ncbi:MAG: pyruvate formate-lyase-activating protein [Clostridia bacterium]